ncbi:MAG: anti-sigma regulatory factor [bacterium]
MNKQKIAIKVEKDIILARKAGREMLRLLGFGTADQTRFATAISELARNIIQYAGDGSCTISDISNGKEVGVEVVFQDNGPGIADIDLAMHYGYSTGKGIGGGLPGAKRLVDKFDIQSEPRNTVVTIQMKR